MTFLDNLFNCSLFNMFPYKHIKNIFFKKSLKIVNTNRTHLINNSKTVENIRIILEKSNSARNRLQISSGDKLFNR